MGPDLTQVFCREYIEHMDWLRGEQISSEAAVRARLAKIGREADHLVQTICDGVPGSKVKDRMTELETRKIEIGSRLETIETPASLMPPKMEGYYHEQVSNRLNMIPPILTMLLASNSSPEC